MTPARRVAGRVITTVDGLDPRRPDALGRGVPGHRGQPVRLLHPRHRRAPRGAAGQGGARPGRPRLRRPGAGRPPLPLHRLADDRRGLGGRGERRGGGRAELGHDRDLVAAARRAELEGRRAPDVSAPTSRSAAAASPTTSAPPDALVAVPDGRGGWAVGETARRGPAGRGQGPGPSNDPSRPQPPLEVPDGRLGSHAAHELGRARLPRDRRVLVRARRRAGQRRWPTAAPSAAKRALAGGRRRPAGWPTSTVEPSGSCCHARTACASARSDRPWPPASGPTGPGWCGWSARRGSSRRSTRWRPGLVVEEVDVVGPPTSADIRAAGWAEAAVLLAALDARGCDGRVSSEVRVASPGGAVAEAAIGGDGVDPRPSRVRRAPRSPWCCGPT